jgi:hypothetical protein
MREFDEGERDSLDQENENADHHNENGNPVHQNPEPEGAEHHSVEKEST